MINKDEVIETCREFINAKSYSGHEDEIMNTIRNTFDKFKFDDYFIDEYGNIIGHIKGKEKGPKILFDGHMDTVPVENMDSWTHDPFAGDIENYRIYGRGTSDMKGALCAMICAAGYFLKDTDRNFKGDIYIAGVVHEECFEGVAARKISEKIKPDLVVIGEASECNLKIGQRGRAEIIVETFGKSAHSANPKIGRNAVYDMADLINEIKNINLSHDDFLGDGILELTDIKSSPYPGASVVPDYCRATYDRRLLVGENKEDVLKPIKDIINKMKQKDNMFNANVSYSKGKEICYTGCEITGERFFPAWKYKISDEFVKKAYECVKKANKDAEITHYSFCTNGSHYAGEAGIKTIGFGPSRENIAHTKDEYVEIDQLILAASGYYEIMNGFLKG